MSVMQLPATMVDQLLGIHQMVMVAMVTCYWSTWPILPNSLCCTILLGVLFSV